MSVDTTSENVTPEAKKKADEVKFFLNEISAARKREKDYLTNGRRVLETYDGEKSQPFGILYSNTETLLPSLYSAVPRPVVQRRFKDEDRLGKLAATAGQRSLEFLLDTNVDGYETFDEALRSAVLTALLPGRGVTGVKYEHDTQDVVPDGADDGAEPVPVKNWETVCLDSQPWDRFLHGYAKKWSKVPWISYEMHLEREDAEKAGIPAAALDKIKFTKGEDAPEAEGATKADETEKNIGERETALFFQIWDRDGGRKVRYLCPQYKDDFCAVLDDPLGLTGFFNCPRPITFVERVHDLVPVAVYLLYEEQAKEINDLTLRISALIKAIKAAGLYDGELGDDIKKILDGEEGELHPTDKSSSLAAEKGLTNAIWMWPVEKLILVLKELYVAREAAKQVIYEITGIADVMRGQTKASETFGAQELKSQWGTLRLKRLQKEVQRYARDLLRMILEVAAKKFSERTFAQMTGLPFVTTEQYKAAQAIVAAAAQAGQQPDEQTQAILNTPVWDQILKLLRDDIQRAYRIDIESNSTVEPEATEDQKMIAEVMNALAQYLNGVAPLVISGALPFEAAQAMMLAIIRRFRFGSEIEDYVKAMKAPTPPDDGKAGAAAADQKVAQAEAKAQQVQNEATLKEQGQALAMREADLAHRENAVKVDEEIRALREEATAARQETVAVKDQAAREKLANDLKLMVETVKSTVKVAMKSSADASAAAKQQQGQNAEAHKAAKVQAQGREQQQATAAMLKGFNEVVTKLDETLAALADSSKALVEVSKAPRDLVVKRNEAGKVTGGRSELLGATP